MDGQEISGRLIRPDGTEQYWWHGVNYINVLPEELIDAVLASEKNKNMEEKKDGNNICGWRNKEKGTG